MAAWLAVSALWRALAHLVSPPVAAPARAFARPARLAVRRPPRRRPLDH